MISFHPTHRQLSEFSLGVMNSAEALIVSSHIDMCPKCRTALEAEQEIVAESVFASAEWAETQTDPALTSMLSEITQQTVDKAISVRFNKHYIELDGRKFELPRTLGRMANKIGNWSHLAGKIWQAPVELGGDSKANFIYMEKGGSVPEHTHRGSEMTLVIDGEFCDGLASYDTGDFMLMTPDHQHEPISHADGGCLVFSIVDQPLHFTSGWARLINPFSHLFFK